MNREQQTFTMSSREIAHLCEKRHDHILRDIEKMLQDIGDPRFGVSSFAAEYTTPQNKKAKEYRLPKNLTVTLITGYRADLRYRVVKRLEELEKENQTQTQPAMLSGPQLMAAALIEAEAMMKAQLSL
jgi:phage regulator Rha-like protein